MNANIRRRPPQRCPQAVLGWLLGFWVLLPQALAQGDPPALDLGAQVVSLPQDVCLTLAQEVLQKRRFAQALERSEVAVVASGNNLTAAISCYGDQGLVHFVVASPRERRSRRVVGRLQEDFAALADSYLTQRQMEDALIGRWRNPDNGETLVFRRDGLVVGRLGDDRYQGRYRFPEPGRLGLNFQQALGTEAPELVFQMKLDGDRLALTDAQGTTARYRRLLP
ncbi:MAG: hypothetical protein ACFCBW_18770 [Candidatus Competibacterales bacterium]